jgi:hypothetical protein
MIPCRPQISPLQKRPGRRKRMTLIAGIRCRDGIVLCADTQETEGDYRSPVQKIIPISIGGHQIIIAGSGHAGLIESFIVQVNGAIAKQCDGLDNVGLREVIESVLVEFYRNDVALCPDPPDEKYLKFFIAASSPKVRQFNAWISENVRLRPLDKHELIGWDAPIYKLALRRLYGEKMSLSQAVLAAIYVLTVAKETSNYVGGALSLAIIRENGIWMEDERYVQTLEDQLKIYESFTSSLLLACADTSIYSADLQTLIDAFSKVVRSLHEKQINAVLDGMLKNSLCVNDPFPRVPPGIMVEMRPEGRVVRHDVNGVEEMIRMINKFNELNASEDEKTKSSTPDDQP